MYRTNTKLIPESATIGASMKEGWPQSPRGGKIPEEPDLEPAFVNPDHIDPVFQGLRGQLEKRVLQPLENTGENILEPKQAQDLNETLRKILPE